MLINRSFPSIRAIMVVSTNRFLPSYQESEEMGEKSSGRTTWFDCMVLWGSSMVAKASVALPTNSARRDLASGLGKDGVAAV